MRLSCGRESFLPDTAGREDLPLLERHIIRAFSAQSQKANSQPYAPRSGGVGPYTWPGNVRELEDVLGHSCIMDGGDIIDVRDLPKHLTRRKDPVNPGEGRGDVVPLEEMQRRYAQQVVDRIHNKAHAADLLSISRTTLYRIPARDHAGKFNRNGSKVS
jgi:transcriptional regulator with PAS, ATPase and Fis domain